MRRLLAAAPAALLVLTACAAGDPVAERRSAVAAITDAANDGDVRIGGGPSTVRQFLQADLIDFMHLAIVPITLGRGVSLWEGLSSLENRFSIETLTSPSGITHQLWNRRDRATPPNV